MKKLLPLLILIASVSVAKAQYYGGYGYGGYGGGNGSYARTVNYGGYSSSTAASYSAPYGNAVYTGAALNGTANIIGAAAPILCQLIGAMTQPRVIVQQVSSRPCDQGYAPYPYPIRYYDP
jgi:hypothetical protein